MAPCPAEPGRREVGAWEDSQTPDFLVSASPRGARPRKGLGSGEMQSGGVQPERSGSGSCWNNRAGLGKMRCEIPGYARGNEPRLFAPQLGEGEGKRCSIFAPRRGGVWGAPAEPAAVPGNGCGASGAGGAVAAGCSPREASPAQPPPASPGAMGFVTRPLRSESGGAYFKKIQRCFLAKRSFRRIVKTQKEKTQSPETCRLPKS